MGVIIDWEAHAKYNTCIRNKIAKGIGIINQAKNYIQRVTLKILYFLFVHPYLSYAKEVWGGMSYSYTSPILKHQRKLIHIITFFPFCNIPEKIE